MMSRLGFPPGPHTAGPRVFGAARAAFAAACLVVVTMAGVAAPASASSLTAAGAAPAVLAGSLPGPVAIRGGGTLRLVASLALSPGNWTFFAKGVVHNVRGEFLGVHVARCALRLGGIGDEALLSPTWPSVDGSRQPFLLLHAAHLVHADRVRLMCAAPGSATGILELADLQLVAMRTGGLRMDDGIGAQDFGSRTSANRIVHAERLASVAVPSSQAEVAFVTLPAGSWAITAEAQLVGTSATVVGCELNAGDFGRAQVAVSRSGAAGADANVALSIVHTFAADGAATLRCGHDGWSGDADIRDIRFTAIHATALTNLDISSGSGRFVARPASAAPVVDAGYADGPLPIGTASPARVTRLSLPAGRWVVVGKAWFEDTVRPPDLVGLTCRLVGPGRADETGLVLAGPGTSDNVQPSMFLWHGTLTRRGRVSLVCGGSGGAPAARWVKLTAVQAATITEVALR
jgi:hypothetical protein